MLSGDEQIMHMSLGFIVRWLLHAKYLSAFVQLDISMKQSDICVKVHALQRDTVMLGTQAVIK